MACFFAVLSAVRRFYLGTQSRIYCLDHNSCCYLQNRIANVQFFAQRYYSRMSTFDNRPFFLKNTATATQIFCYFCCNPGNHFIKAIGGIRCVAFRVVRYLLSIRVFLNCPVNYPILCIYSSNPKLRTRSVRQFSLTIRAADSGRRAHHRCSVDGCPWRMDFSRADCVLIASSGSSTSISYFLYSVIFFFFESKDFIPQNLSYQQVVKNMQYSKYPFPQGF